MIKFIIGGVVKVQVFLNNILEVNEIRENAMHTVEVIRQNLNKREILCPTNFGTIVRPIH